MMIATLTSNPIHLGRALRRMRHRELVRQRRRDFWRGVKIRLKRFFRPLPGIPE